MNCRAFALVPILLAAAAEPARAQVLAGAASTVITPQLTPGSPVWLAGFGQGRAATGVHDDLRARCLALTVETRTVVFCGVDSIGLFRDDTLKIRERVAASLGRAVIVHVAATHVHQAPDTMGLWGPSQGVSGIDETYLAFLVERTAACAVDAVKSAVPATLRLARTKWPGILSFFDDGRPPFVHDEEVLALAAETREGTRIATLVNWASHPEALGSKNTVITADWPASLYATLERKAGGVAVFLNGAVGGMMSPLGAKVVDPVTGQPAPPRTFRFAEVVGTRVADEALAALAAAPPVKVTALRSLETLVRIPLTNDGYKKAAALDLFKGRKAFVEGKFTEAPVGYVRVDSGDSPVLEIALIPGELYPELSVGGVTPDPAGDFAGAPIETPVKSLMRAPFRMLVGLANDEIGYIIPKSQWDEQPPFTFGASKRWYGEINSVGPDAAPIIVDAFRSLLAGK